MFTQKFDSYVCHQDIITAEVEGLTMVATIEYDQDSHINDDDCHNTDQTVTGCDDAQQEKLLEARKAWFHDEWFYCGIVLSIYKRGICLSTHAASLWSIEANYPNTDNSYLTEVANDLLQEAIEEGKAIIAKLLD
jgi:hypothetical protein